MDQLRCDGVDIVLQEVPDEVSLAINITGCPYRCAGCHSSHLQREYGDYVGDVLPMALKQYSGLITCVCFMGGDQHMDDLIKHCTYIRKNYPWLRIAIYTGTSSLEEIKPCLHLLDYAKVGPYCENAGGLDKTNTNQRMFKKGAFGAWRDITKRFWRK